MLLTVPYGWEIGAAYIRESHAKSLEGDQAVAQLVAVLRSFAQRHIFVPWDLVVLENESGVDLLARGGFNGLLALASDRTYSHLGCFEADRLARSTVDGPDVINTCRRYGVKVHWLGRAEIDPRNPAQWQSDQVQFQSAEYVSRSTSYKVGTNREHASLAGVPLGRLPEGYEVATRGLALNGRAGPPVGWRLVEPLASVIREGRELYVSGGMSFRGLAEWSLTTKLAGETPAKRPMDREWWRTTLTNPKYAGFQVPSTYLGYRRDVAEEERRMARRHSRSLDPSNFVPCKLPAIFTLEEFLETIRQMRLRRKFERGRRPRDASVLSGLLIDARCGHRMHILNRDADGVARARCALAYSGEKVCSSSFRINDVEDDVGALVRGLMFRDPALVALVDAELRLRLPSARRHPSRAAKEVGRLRQLMNNAGDFPKLREAIAAELAEAEQRLNAETSGDEERTFIATIADLERWPAIWDDANGEGRNALLKTLFAGVAVEPTRRMPRGATKPRGTPPRAACVAAIRVRSDPAALALATSVAAAKLGMERETGFEPATFSLGS